MRFIALIAPASQVGALPFARSGPSLAARWLALPFDALRSQYANAVRAGFVERSLLALGRLEHTLALVEQLVLGPWARRV